MIDKDSHGASDGDLHILLKPDAKDDSDLMNSANGNRMTVEVICWGKPSPSYTNEWVPFCNNVDPHDIFLILRMVTMCVLLVNGFKMWDIQLQHAPNGTKSIQ